MNYEKAYALLFNAITEAIGELYKSKLVTMELSEQKFNVVVGCKILF